MREHIFKHISREPNDLEMAVIRALTSEHCSYKSSKRFISKFYNKNENIIDAQGEGAGIVKFCDKNSIVFKIESHNHPSSINPYQGAATGVGGVLRDIFTMGAHPIGILDAIFVSNNHPEKLKYMREIVKGIGGYANCFGVTHRGNFTSDYNIHGDNHSVLVNAMAIGVARTDSIIYSKLNSDHETILYVGLPVTGENTSGAEMSSVGLNSSIDDSNSISYADPFKGRMLYEFCDLLKQENIDCAMQDMGAAGISCALFEMSKKSNCGFKVHVQAIPVSNNNLTPADIMLSETQERLLLVAKNNDIGKIMKIADKCLIACASIGYVCRDSRHVTIVNNNSNILDLPSDIIDINHDEAKILYRDNDNIRDNASLKYNIPINLEECNSNNLDIIAIIHRMSKYIIINDDIVNQYDKTILGLSLYQSNREAAVFAIEHDANYAVVSTITSCPHLSIISPYLAAKISVCDGYRRIIAQSGKPLAITNNLNFGNSSDQYVLGDMDLSVDGINDAAKIFDTPIVSGNVSMNNCSQNTSINPSVVIGMVGKVDKISHITQREKDHSSCIIVQIMHDNQPSLSGSLFEKVYFDRICHFDVNINDEHRIGYTVRRILQENKIFDACSIGYGGSIFALYKLMLHYNFAFSIDFDNADYNNLFSEYGSAYNIIIKQDIVNDIVKDIDFGNLKYKIIGKIVENNGFINTKFGKISIDALKSQFIKYV